MHNDPVCPRVLVIDDQETSRYIFARILTKAGFIVEEASTGSEGLDKATSLPDLVIADVNLPDMLGYEVVQRLKANPLTGSIPILQMSASFVSNESRVQGLEGGADSYLIQPIEPAVLLAQVKALIRIRRAESLSHLSALQWQATFDSLGDGLALADSDGMLVRVNAAFLELLSFNYPQIKGRQLREVFALRFEADFDQLMTRGRLLQPKELQSGDRWFRVRYDTIGTDVGQASGAILILTDITDYKKLQETLKMSERLSATGRMAHIIAHEINNPLEALSNLLYLAGRCSQDNGDLSRYIEQSAHELDRISTITKQILAYHRESAVPSLASAGEIVESVLAMLRAHIAQRGVTLKTSIVCFERILVLSGELRQVFNNIITNALDAFAPGSNGRLLVRCTRSRNYTTDRPGVRFVFSDSGTGIPKDVLPKIFDAFFTTKEEGGSGIGLWLSGEVVAKHDGSIRIRTRTEGLYMGTLFDVFIPFPEGNG